jgi:hypothetical protein
MSVKWDRDVYLHSTHLTCVAACHCDIGGAVFVERRLSARSLFPVVDFGTQYTADYIVPS